MLWDGTYVLIRESWKFNRLQMSLQRQLFLLIYLKTQNVGPAGVWTRDLPLSRPALSQLSQPGDLCAGNFHSISPHMSTSQESRLRQTANSRFKLKISQSSKWADKNSLKQFLWMKITWNNHFFCRTKESKRTVKKKRESFGHVVQLHVRRYCDTKSLIQ